MMRTLLTLAVLPLITILCGVPATVLSLLRVHGATIVAGRIWSRVLLACVGAKVEYEGIERTRTNSPVIYLSNHLSNVDIWVLLAVLPLHSRFVAKESIFKIPILGWAMKSAGFISVDRGNRTKAIQSLRRAADTIRAGAAVVLFPEGTRSMTGALQPFKKGPFHLASQSRVPIVPVIIEGSYELLPPRTLRIQPGIVRVRFLPEIPPEQFADLSPDELRRRLHKQFTAELNTNSNAEDSSQHAAQA